MRNVRLVARRELGAMLRSPMGYVVVVLVLFVDGLLFNYYALGGTPKLSSRVLQLFFAYATFMNLVAGVLLAMRLVAEERQLGTLNLLLGSPLREVEIVLGKFLAAFVFLCGMTLLTLYMPALIFVNGKVSYGQIAAGYLGLFFIGGLALSAGLFASSLARSQVVAAVTAGAILTAIYLCHLGASVAEPPLRDFMAYLSFFKHLQWQNGVITSRDVVYYLSFIYFFLMLATQVLQARRWR